MFSLFSFVTSQPCIHEAVDPTYLKKFQILYLGTSRFKYEAFDHRVSEATFQNKFR